MKRPRKRTLLTALGCALIALGVFAAFYGMLLHGNLEYLELKAHDLWVNVQPRDSRMSKDIVVVVIKEDEVRRMKQEYPLRDAPLLDLLNGIQGQKPLAIGLDLFRDRELPPGDIELRRFIRSNSNVLFVCRVAPEGRDDKMVPPPPVFQTYNRANRADFLAQRIGVAVVTPDRDGIVRRGILRQRNEQGEAQRQQNLDPTQCDPTCYLSLSALMARAYALKNPVGSEDESDLEVGEDYAKFGATRFARFFPNQTPYVNQLTSGFEFLLDYRGGDENRQFRQLTMTEAMKAPPETFTGKLVFVGTEAVTSNDHVATPVTREERDVVTQVRKFRNDVAGVQLQAQMCDQLLRGCYFGTRPVRTLGPMASAVWLGFWTIFAVLFGVVVRGPGRFATGVICGLIITTIGAYSCYVRGWWIPVAAPSMAWFTGAAISTSYMAYRERANREMLKKLFGPYIERSVLEKLLEDPERLIVDGRLRQEKLTATVLFTDMVGYSTVSEKFNDPQALMSWLDEYMSAMSELVISHGGMVDKYIGDAVMAVFGAPISQGIVEDARHAVGCALAMREKLKMLNASFAARNIPEVGMRVGVATGELVAGSLGGADRLEYTVIGDIVNTASRLESVGKNNPGVPPSVLAGRCRILVAGPQVESPRAGNSTYELARDQFEMVRVPGIEEEGLKGMQKHLEIFGVVGAKDSLAGIGEIEPARAIETPQPVTIPKPQPATEVPS